MPGSTACSAQANRPLNRELSKGDHAMGTMQSEEIFEWEKKKRRLLDTEISLGSLCLFSCGRSLKIVALHVRSTAVRRWYRVPQKDVEEQRQSKNAHRRESGASEEHLS